ncbi:GNAT family N-acetyltransferase [Clostridium botulinum]|uniref:GNAT family N-acetyltransferase n=1 Tax=Clostridium botulinum TaxID=1491 RepID=UPI00224746E6|nr:GNAT family N-acetyltransferase [Clostridium botulinum]UZP04735.1 GNAT family N-acetyltransferase [Clostridium botulinum]UZP08147.1 GNAT family N-acetyltransferase [Clostridium botulinum]UZP11474.1 GNAT family N-acetyltransferase [Clostridium botulinum]
MGNLELRKNTNPLWAEIHLENIQLFEDAYGVKFTKEEIDDQRMKIGNGTSDRRVVEEGECYEVYDDSIYVGDITVDLSDENPEIDIIIFAQHGGMGYAKKAIQRFIEFEGRGFEKIECTVRYKNPNLLKVENIIKELGFQYIDSSKEVKIYRYDRG